MPTIADKIIAFNEALRFTDSLPHGFSVVNPFMDNPETMLVMRQFYQKFYNDDKPRRMILGINPSRHGAALTGVPFTDTKRLESVCGIRMESAYSHEVSSVFVYEMIRQYGGAESFYRDFYINSPFPLAILRNAKGKWLNANYYDDPALFEAVKPFMIKTLKQHVGIGKDTSKAFVLGKKNAVFLHQINQQEKLFDELVVLEHPRFIQQYRLRFRDEYILKYLEAFAHGRGEAIL